MTDPPRVSSEPGVLDGAELDRRWFLIGSATAAATMVAVLNAPPALAAGWTYPTSILSITSPFGPRVRPTTGASTMHRGVDLAGSPHNAAVVSVANGTVLESAADSSRGNYVTIRHGDGSSTRYQHMAASPLVGVGQSVSAGQQLGNIGTTGVSSGPHLHFETFNVGVAADAGSFSATDPEAFMAARGVVLRPGGVPVIAPPAGPSYVEEEIMLVRYNGTPYSITPLSIQPVSATAVAVIETATGRSTINIDANGFSALQAMVGAHIVDSAANLKGQGL